VRRSHPKQLILESNCTHRFGALTHAEGRFQFRRFDSANRMFRMVPVSGERRPVRRSDSTSSVLDSKRRNSESKLAQVPKQSEFTHSGSLVAAEHLDREDSSSMVTAGATANTTGGEQSRI